jgi:hypothetical protein
MILIEKLFVGTVSLIVRIFKIKPEKRYKWEPMKKDEELGSSAYPLVLVQIPMYNEKEVVYLNIIEVRIIIIHIVSVNTKSREFLLVMNFCVKLWNVCKGIQAFHWSSMWVGLAFGPGNNTGFG